MNLLFASFLLLVFLQQAVVVAFQPLPTTFKQHLGQALYKELRATNDEIIEQLQKEYRELQDELFVYLALDRKDEAAHTSEQMFQKAADLTQVERYQEYLHVKDSADHVKHAQQDVEVAQELVSKAHNDALVADYKTFHVDSMQDVFDEAKHEDDLLKAEEAHQAEEMASDVWTDVQFEELQAEVEYDNAEMLLRDLQENEQLLQRSLNQIRQTHLLSDHWATQEMPKHAKFLDKARHVIKSGKLIDHDPTKGNVAF